MKNTILNIGIRKAIEVTQLFIGKKAVHHALEFVDWLNSHITRFQKASRTLKELIFSSATQHSVILTPESPQFYVEEMKTFFSKTSPPHFIINRSASGFSIPNEGLPLYEELRHLCDLEASLIQQLVLHFKIFEVEKFSMMLMGEDSPEELLKFIQA